MSIVNVKLKTLHNYINVRRLYCTYLPENNIINVELNKLVYNSSCKGALSNRNINI